MTMCSLCSGDVRANTSSRWRSAQLHMYASNAAMSAPVSTQACATLGERRTTEAPIGPNLLCHHADQREDRSGAAAKRGGVVLAASTAVCGTLTATSAVGLLGAAR